jgi:hypothetical protein
VGTEEGKPIGLLVGAWVLSIVGDTVPRIEGATDEFSAGPSFGLADGDLVVKPLGPGEDTVGRLLVLSAGDPVGEIVETGWETVGDPVRFPVGEPVGGEVGESV